MGRAVRSRLWEGQQPITHPEVSNKGQGPQDTTQAGFWVEGRSLTHLQRGPGLAIPCGVSRALQVLPYPHAMPVAPPPHWALAALGGSCSQTHSCAQPLLSIDYPQSLGTRDCLRCLRSLSLYPPRSRVDSKTLTRNTRIIAEALTRVIYNLTEKVSIWFWPWLCGCTQPCGASSHPVPSLYRGRPQTCQCSRSRW